MQKKARDLAALVHGELIGKDVVVTGIAGLREAVQGDLSLVSSPKYASFAEKTHASVIVVGQDFSSKTACPLIRVENAAEAFAQIAALFEPSPIQFSPGCHSTAVISKNVTLGQDISIQPYAVIEEGAIIGSRSVIGAGCYIGHHTRVGDDCLLYPHVMIRERCLVGNRVIIHSGTVVGADGFGYERTPDGPKKIPQTGIVQIEDDVEIGSNTSIDRARFGKTYIGRNVKIDNLVQIAHNVQIGDHTVICGTTGIAGSVIIGKHVTIAAQVGIAGHLRIGDGAIIEAQSGVAKDVLPGERCLGTPAKPLREAMRLYAGTLRLSEMDKRLKALEAQSAHPNSARKMSK